MINSDQYYQEAISFWRCAKVVQISSERFDDPQFLSSPIAYLFRHSVELLLKALIVRDGENIYESISDLKLPPHNKYLTAMHSIMELYNTWTSIIDSSLFCAVDKQSLSIIEEHIKRIDKCDYNSTFFRYPFDKKGHPQSKEFVKPLSKQELAHLPCSIGSEEGAKRTGNWYVWHGDKSLSWIDTNLDHLFKLLCSYYTGKDIEDQKTELYLKEPIR